MTIESDNFLKELDHVCADTALIVAKSIEGTKARKGRFNLFTTLLKISDETRLHSRFIHFLLNPNAHHDCGDLFLQAFAETIKEYPNQPEFGIVNSAFQYGRTEQPTHKGRRIDIYLVFRDGKIAIENKIWAHEQEDQIKDYSEYIKSDEATNLLFYLTLFGDEANTSENCVYFKISYQTHILAWLEKCLSRSYEHVNINQALQQYRDVVLELTGRSKNMEQIKEIKKLIRTKPGFLKNFHLVTQSVEELKDASWHLLLHEIAHELKAIENITYIRDYHGDYKDPRNSPSDTWILFKIKDLEFCLGIAKTGNNRIAVTMFPGNSDGSSLHEKGLVQRLFAELQKQVDSGLSSGWWGIYYEVPDCKPLNDPEFSLELLDEDSRGGIVKRASDSIKDFVNSAARIQGEV